VFIFFFFFFSCKKDRIGVIMDWLLIIIFLWIVSSYLYRTRSHRVDPKDLTRQNIDFLEQQMEFKLSLLKDSTKPKPIFSPTKDSTPELADIALIPKSQFMFISAELKQAYMQSKEWKALKLSRLKIAQHQCEHCGSVYSLQLHHITYERITQEEINDVAILCNICHQKIHDKLGYDRATKYPISILKD
jgi:hypothetical protein